MAEFAILLRGGPADLTTLSSADRAQMAEKYDGWFGQLAATGRLKGAQKLKATGKSLRPQPGGKPFITDGPFGETKEMVGGVFFLEAATYEEAIELMQTSPQLAYGGIVEIREVDCLDEMG